MKMLSKNIQATALSQFCIGIAVAFLFCFLPLITLAEDSEESGDEVMEESMMEEDSGSSQFFTSMDLHGSLHSTYYFRNSGSDDDHDFSNYLSLQADDIWKDRISAGVSLLWHQDLDGKDNNRTDPFIDLDQANRQNVRVFTGYGDIKGIGWDESRMRLGRQYFEDVDYVHFDGLSYQFEPVDRLDIGVFGGRPVSFYSSNDGEAVYGFYSEYQFTPQTKASARYYRYDADGYNDDLGAVEVWHLFTPNIKTHVEFSMLDANPYMIQADLLARCDALDLDTTFQIVHLFDDVAGHTIEFNPVFPLLNSYEPFTRGSVYAVKGMGQYWALTSGIDVREADDTNAVIDNTNRDYRRYSAGAEFYPVEKVTVSVSGEFWDVDPNDEFTGITGEVEYEPIQQLSLTAGVDYGEFIQEFRDEFLFFNGINNVFRVSPDVLTYYGRIRWKPNQTVYSSLLVEVEDNDIDPDEYYSVRLEVGIRF